jgi:hypothetical protein
MDQTELEKENIMRLDPGPRRRAAASSWSFCLLSVIGIVTIFTVIALAVVYQFASGFVRDMREPHRALYHNASAPAAPSIGPLLLGDTKFDIVATVWVRAPRTEEREFNVKHAGADSAAENAYDNVLPADVPYLLEYALFSGVVFRGLRMHDKHVDAEVNLTIPTARLCVRLLLLKWFANVAL